jgi:deoxyribodipyrimidine photo-lyase
VSTAALFPPTRDAALARIAALRPADYARSRNAIDGAVSMLSPYITHGLLSLPEVLDGVAARHRIGMQHKFVFELGWREHFRHVWQHRGDVIFASLHAGMLPDEAYAREVPADIRQARTGVPVIDRAVHTLQTTGWLHNHARMWLASYVVHLRKVHWRSGADWMVAQLLDGDLASNHLSWQWVAGTASRKPYLFNAENVARFAPADWHSGGTVIDQSYAALDTFARRPQAVPSSARGDGVAEAQTTARPPVAWPTTAPSVADVGGRDVWLVHPWALREPPADLPAGCLPVGLLVSDFHERWPWSAARWGFVGAAMAALSGVNWYGSAAATAQALAAARSVQTLDDPHLAALLPAGVRRRAAPKLFAEVARPCASFSQWWSRVTRDVQALQDLPGLAALRRNGSAGPLFDAAGEPD